MVIQSLGRGSSGYKEALGELGTGLGALAGTLVGAKLGSVARKHQEDAQTDAYIASGIPAHQARKLARADAFTQQSVLQEHIARGGLANAPQQQDQFQQQPQLQQGAIPQLAALKAMSMPQFQGAQPSQYQNVMSSIGAPGQGPAAAQQGLQNLQTASALSLLQGPKAMAPIGEQGLKNLLKSQQAQQLPQQQVPQTQQAPVAQVPIQAAPVIPTAVQPRIAPARQALINDAFSGGPNSQSAWQKLMQGPTTAERKVLEKEERVKSAAEEKEAKLEYQKIRKEYESAKEQEADLKRMRKLIEKGKLTNPVLHSAINTLEHGIFGVGVNIHALESYDAQEFQKLTTRMLSNIREVFPKATNLDVQQYLKQLPNLSQSDEAKLRNISSLEKVVKAKEIRKQEADKILKENGGRFPADFNFILSDRVEPRTNKLYEEFVNKIGGEEYGV